MAPSHFDKRVRDWSARKHDILKEYLPTFCRALSRRANGSTIWYIDGYAGAGIYKDPADLSDLGTPGSPVLAATETQKLAYDIRCLNVEEDKDNFESLQRETTSFQHVENIHADFNSVIGDVLKRVQNSPAFFFLDPFGTNDLPMQGLIDRIALRTKQTDILLRYATETVRRLAGSHEKDMVRGSANAQNLDKWFRGDKWRSILQQHPAGSKRDEELLEYYQQQLVSISGGRLAFAKAYPIRALNGQVKYHLVFASGDRLGIKLMSDILYKAEAKYNADHEAYQQQIENPAGQLQFDLFNDQQADPSVQQIHRIEAIKIDILRVGQTMKQDWEFYELLYELILNQNWFARFSEKEFRAACKALHTQARIKRLTSGGAWKQGTCFYIEPNP
jgi:three-Cys-motif partner protein